MDKIKEYLKVINSAHEAGNMTDPQHKRAVGNAPKRCMVLAAPFFMAVLQDNAPQSGPVDIADNQPAAVVETENSPSSILG